MNNKHEEIERHYIMSHKAWYAGANNIFLPTFDLILSTKSGEHIGSISVNWCDLNGDRAVELRCFDDAWYVLTKLTDVFRRINQLPKGFTDLHFKELLDTSGFIDKTAYKLPKLRKSTSALSPFKNMERRRKKG